MVQGRRRRERQGSRLAQPNVCTHTHTRCASALHEVPLVAGVAAADSHARHVKWHRARKTAGRVGLRALATLFTLRHDQRFGIMARDGQRRAAGRGRDASRGLKAGLRVCVYMRMVNLCMHDERGV